MSSSIETGRHPNPRGTDTSNQEEIMMMQATHETIRPWEDRVKSLEKELEETK